ncbi:sulfite exporter TauE/SafE family protein [Runella sp.]|uniref:sulfite exporter TauE/SafE family protein n=1 Tax=Runella sp. TaxID=1960881 RepID=UPI003D0B75F1
MVETQSQGRVFLGNRLLYGLFVSIFAIAIALTIWQLYGTDIKPFAESFFTAETLLFIGAGFLAQTIDGALGMAYGISSTSLLLSLGVSPAAASASVHIAEVFTSGASGLSHWKFGNVNKKLFKLLLIPGIIGAVTGAYILSSFDGKIIRPYISAYLLIMGIVVILKAIRKKTPKKKTRFVGPLALLGGFVDAVGGGGWGPVVTSTLIGSGRDPRYTIGSVNTSEFFIAAAGAGMFTLMIGIDNWRVIIGLLLGGVIASPFAAFVCGKVNPKILMIFVGIVIIALSVRNIVTLF